MNLQRDGKRCPWKAMQVTDDLHTMLAADNFKAGNNRRARWHIATRDQLRAAVDDSTSIWCGKPVTGYTEVRNG